MTDIYENGIPVSKKGTGVPFNHFASGRLSAGIASHGGLTYLSFIGKQKLSRGTIFSASESSAFTKLGRVQILIDGTPFYLEFNHTEFFPFGYSSECEFRNVRFRHELILDQNSLFQRILVTANPENHAVRARLLQHGGWTAAENRKNSGWQIMPDGAMRGKITEEEENAEVTVKLSANLPCKTYSRHEPFKYYMETTEAANETIFTFSFDSEGENASTRMNCAIADYRRKMEQGIRFFTGSPIVDSALNNVGPMLDALAVSGKPGAVRASQHYWIWGWDSMVHAESYLWSGRSEVIRDMLDFYRETADPERGVGHAFTTDFKPFVIMRTCSQGLYAVLLHNYYAVTGDIETLKRNFPFALLLLNRAGANRHPQCSLGTGIGYFPDFPEMLEQKKQDVCLINNSLYLQALRAIAALEQELKISDDADRHTKEADLLQHDMERILWDESAGYWVDSASAESLEKRKYYPLYGQLHVSPFGTDPRKMDEKSIANFLKKNFLFKNGLYMYPADKPGFMADGNQLGAYYPPMDRYYWNMMNLSADQDSAKDFTRILEYFWSQLTYPEGLTHETENEDPTVDNPGGKQAFTAKGWFCDAVELHLGLRVYVDGFTCHPLKTGAPFRIENMILRGKKFTFERLESGTVLMNGVPLPDEKIFWKNLEK